MVISSLQLLVLSFAMKIGCDINLVKNRILMNFDNFQGYFLKLYTTYSFISFLENLPLKIMYTSMVLNKNKSKCLLKQFLVFNKFK